MPIIASYNIHSCVGRDGRLDPLRIVEVIREMNADIVALQEVDAQHRIDGYLDQWVFLAEELGYCCTPGISLRTHRRNYGNALLSRAPVRRIRLHDLSVDKREPRGAIEVDLDFGSRPPLRVIATHLGLRPAERRRQLEKLLAVLDDGNEVSATVLLGDFNEWLGVSRNLRLLGDVFRTSPAPCTFPSGWPLFALDRIFSTGAARLSDVSVHRSALARLASDHLPVRAVLHPVDGAIRVPP